MRTKNKATIALFYFLLAVFAVCDAKESSDPTIPAVPSLYPVMDSGVWADALHNSFIYWLDNNRVLFKNSEEKEKAKHYRGRFNLSIWDIRTNKVTPYSEYAKSLSVCYREGFIYYILTDENKNQRRFAGEFGKEKPFVPPTAKNVRYNEMDCRFCADPAPAEKLEGPKRHDLRFLLHRHGYLDFGLSSESNLAKPTLYYRKGLDKPISLPFMNRDITYYQFKDAYLFHPLGKEITGRDFLWLYPDGKTEEIKFPNVSDRKLVYGNKYYTRKGFFVYFYDGQPPSFKVPGNTGGYLVAEDGKSSKVISGYLKGIVVSPDGCKIAFVHYPYLDATLVADPAPITLKMINFCTEEKSP
ncbi:MAG: hypothetical protein HY851_09980 [candidate division Zixibacteria bacterium]|nr:hypothetical protein [candidate division Zixibacteria bacterium]